MFPVLTYPHPQNCNGAPFCGDGIIGGYVMHDPTLPSIDGCYVYGDLSTAGLRMVALGQPSAAASVALGPQIGSLSTFGLDASGHLYAADIGSGDVYRIESDGNPATDPRCAPPPPPSPPVVTCSRRPEPVRPGRRHPSGAEADGAEDHARRDGDVLIGGRTLGPGDYRLVARTGNGAKSVHVRFSIPARLGQ